MKPCLLIALLILTLMTNAQNNYYNINIEQPKLYFPDLNYNEPKSTYVGSSNDAMLDAVNALDRKYTANKNDYENFISSANRVLDPDEKSLRHRCQVYALNNFIERIKKTVVDNRWEWASDAIRDAKTKYHSDLNEYVEIEAAKLKESKNQADKYCREGEDFVVKKDYKASLASFNEALQLYPNYPNALAGRAKSYNGLQDYPYALRDLEYLIVNYPDNPFGYDLRSTVYANQKKFNLALSDCNKLIELKTSSPGSYAKRAYLKGELEDYQGAIQDLNNAIELAPSDASYYLQRGLKKTGLKDYFGAIADYQKAIDLQPNYSMAYNNIAWNKFLQKKYTEALSYANKAIEQDSTNYVALDTRGEIKFNLNDIRGCIKDFDNAIKFNPKLSNSFFLRGRANLKLQNKTKGCEDLSKAGELGKKEAYDYINKYCQ